MRFEELPANIKQLVAGRSDGEVVFRPPVTDEEPGEFVRFRQVEFEGLLTHCDLLYPPRNAVPPKTGRGQGFSALNERILVSNVRDVLLDDDAVHYTDLSLQLYQYNQIECFVATDEALNVLQSANCIGEDMVRDVHHLTDNGIEPTIWKLVDFPLAPVIDYSRSSARWLISSSRRNPELPRSYVPGLIDLPGEIRVQASVDHSVNILRDITRPTFIFVRRNVIEKLMQESINGPDYTVLSSRA